MAETNDDTRSDEASVAGADYDPHDRDTSWVDREAYPFESRCVGLEAGGLHYVDEGGDHDAPVVMLHGNPTWSFLYRHLVDGLSDSYRCVVPDYLGFGLSERPPEFSYRPSDHADIIAAFVDRLGLEEIVLVVQDWGGPIGLSYAVDNPDNVRGIVAMNTFCWPLDDRLDMRAFSWLAGGPIGRVLCDEFDAFTRVVMPTAFGDPARLSGAAHRQYLQSHAGRDRTGTWVFPRALVGETEWLADLWDRAGAIEDVPALLPWGMEDDAFDADCLRRFEILFRESESVELDGIGHYLQEELGDDLLPPVREFLDGL